MPKCRWTENKMHKNWESTGVRCWSAACLPRWQHRADLVSRWCHSVMCFWQVCKTWTNHASCVYSVIFTQDWRCASTNADAHPSQAHNYLYRLASFCSFLLHLGIACYVRVKLSIIFRYSCVFGDSWTVSKLYWASSCCTRTSRSAGGGRSLSGIKREQENS